MKHIKSFTNFPYISYLFCFLIYLVALAKILLEIALAHELVVTFSINPTKGSLATKS